MNTSRKASSGAATGASSASLQDMIDEVVKKSNDAFQETLGNSANDLFWEPKAVTMISFEGDFKVKVLKVIRKLVMGVSDVKIKDFVDTTIQKLHPYLWGKIRTNGRLHVYLPVFRGR
jgi:ribosomal protein L7/L12